MEISDVKKKWTEVFSEQSHNSDLPEAGVLCNLEINNHYPWEQNPTNI